MSQKLEKKNFQLYQVFMSQENQTRKTISSLHAYLFVSKWLNTHKDF